MVCVWFDAYRRSLRLPWSREIHDLQPPVDWRLKGTSSWINHITGRDQIASGCQEEPQSALAVVDGDE